MKHLIIILVFSFFVCILNSIQVSGEQSGTWGSENNPYQIVGNIYIPHSSTLCIEPGVQILVMGDFGICSYGNIVANGTPSDSIRFVSGLDDRTLTWGGIRLDNSTAISLFSYCRIERGETGLNTVNSSVEISYCYFNKNHIGIEFNWGTTGNNAVVGIDHNKIENSKYNGINLYPNSNVDISYNEILHNNNSQSEHSGAVTVIGSSGNICNPQIHHNFIHHNNSYGLTIYQIGSVSSLQPDVHDNLVEYNYIGIFIRASSGNYYRNTVRYNIIPNKEGTGVGIYIDDSRAAPYLAENIIKGNYRGIVVFQSSPILGKLSLNHPWAHGRNVIKNNYDANNVLHSIEARNYNYESLPPLYAQNNYWDYDNAAQISETITDHNDYESYPTVIFDPWRTLTGPVYLTGTVTLPGAENQDCLLQLVSAVSGAILNEWTIRVGIPFSVQTEQDSLVYIIAKYTGTDTVTHYGAYGGNDTPVASQITGESIFDAGEIILGDAPLWSYLRVGSNQYINGHDCYLLNKSWFVYSPDETMWLFRDGDFLKVSRISAIVNGQVHNLNLSEPPIWRITGNLETVDTWEQFLGSDMEDYTFYTGTATLTKRIRTNLYGELSNYNMIYLSTEQGTKAQLYDNFNGNWVSFTYDPITFCMVDYEIETPINVESDNSLFPMVTGNSWKVTRALQNIAPTYFGYREMANFLQFQWNPPSLSSINYTQYRLYDNGVLWVQLPMNYVNYSTYIPGDGLQHSYSLAAWDGETEYFCENTLEVTFTDNEDDVVVTPQLSIYPNPFYPIGDTGLNIHYDFGKEASLDVSIYNLKGQRVYSFKADKADKELTWNGKDFSGKTCASGLYQIRLTNNAGKNICKKVMLLH